MLTVYVDGQDFVVY